MKGRLNRESNPVPGEKPGFLPQHESETSGEFVVTGERNPYPVKVKNTDGQAIPVKLTGSFVEVGRVLGVTVAPGSRNTVFIFPTTKTELDFKEIVIVIRRQNVEHTYKVDVYWYVPEYTINSVIYGEIGIINTNDSWGYAKTPVKATSFRIFITNNGQTDCSYDVYIFGVR